MLCEPVNAVQFAELEVSVWLPEVAVITDKYTDS
jgi:hypothetical protein